MTHGTQTGGSSGPRLGRCAEPLATAYDLVMLDLDGVVYVGTEPVARAPEALQEVRKRGARVAFVTNNAARTAGGVADHLGTLGVQATEDDVVTSAQAVARLVSEAVPAGATVLVVGGDGLVEALTERHLRPVTGYADGVRAVVQGFHPDVGWRLLAEGAYAVAAGVPWFASNMDTTLPTPRGTAPGNGTLVAAIASATGARPVVAGKPETPLFEEAMRRMGGSRPLVVGDRLTTDIEGARRAGLDSLLVLTGVTGVPDLLEAPAERRPVYVGGDLSALLAPQPAVDGGWDSATWSCDGWRVQLDGDRLSVEQPEGEHQDRPAGMVGLLRATVEAAWAGRDRTGRTPDASAALETLEALERG